MAAMDSPGALPESPLDENDMVYPCKGCGNVRGLDLMSGRTLLTVLSDIGRRQSI